MSSRQFNDSPWPLQTPHSSASSSSSGSSKRKRAPSPRYTRASVFTRQIVDQAAIDAAKALCENTDNSVLSCWPTSATTMNQNEFTQFVWNSRQPSFAQFGEVDIALLRADTGSTVATYPRTPNPPNRAGALPIQAGDPWWGSNGETFNGTSVPFPFYFVIVQSGQPLSNGLPQATFTATQTTFASSVLAAMSSSSAAESSSAAALSSSLASASASLDTTGASTATTPHGSGVGGSGLQDSNGSSSFPHWAIAVITTLGFLALVAFIALIFLLVRYQRRRKEAASPSRRGSIGSQSPMMANAQSAGDAYPSSPPLVPIGMPTSVGAGSSMIGAQPGRADSTVSRDGASTHSDLPFTGADAAFMAEAFRAALRKPDFQGQTVEEGESPEASQEPAQDEALLSHHLAEEGKDIRSVSSSRGVKVETLNEGDDASAARNGRS